MQGVDQQHPLKDPSTVKCQDQLYQLSTKRLLSLQGHPFAQLFEGTFYPWEALARVPSFLQNIISQTPKDERNKGNLIGSVFIDENVIIGEGTVIQHGAMIKGPALIGRNCELRKGAYVRGNVVIGDGTVIGNSSQIKHSIILDRAEISHFNYVGDSVVAQKAHMAAGAITSNLKLDSSPVNIIFDGHKIPTGMPKFGAFLGQSCQIGCNAILNPGSIIGREAVVYPMVNFRGYLPARHICKLIQSQNVVVRL